MQIDKKFPFRPLSQLSVTFIEFIVLYTLVKEEATGTHYWLVTATFTSTCLMTKTLFIVGFLFCCPHRYVDLVLVHVLVQEKAKATLRWRVTANLQVMSNNACVDGNSPKYPVIFVFPVRQISVAVLIQTLAEKKEKQTSPWGVTTNFTSNGRPVLVQRPLINGRPVLVQRPLITTERSYLTSCRQGTFKTY